MLREDLRISARYLAMLSALAGTIVLFGSTSAFAKDCFGALRPALERGGYGGGLDCREIDVHIKYIGRTKSRHAPSYDVYDLVYSTKDNPGGYPHVGERILIFDSQAKYLGHYHIEGPHRLQIVGSDVILLDEPVNNGNRLHLGQASPPPSQWLEGDQVGLDR